MYETNASSVQQIIRLPQVRQRTGLSRSTIYLRVARGEFPRPIKLGVRASGWIADEVVALRAHHLRLGRQPPRGGGVHDPGAVALEGRALRRGDPFGRLGDVALARRRPCLAR